MLKTVGKIKVEEGDNSNFEYSLVYRMQRLLEGSRKLWTLNATILLMDKYRAPFFSSTFLQG